MSKATGVLSMLNEGKSKATFEVLVKHTKDFDGGKYIENAKSVTFPTIGVELIPGTHQIRIQSESSNKWKQTIVVDGISHQETKDSSHRIKAIGVKGKEHYIAPILFDKNPIRVRCSCYDFQFTGGYWIDTILNGLVGGKIKKYVRKTTTRPERNPKHIPCMCKHLTSLVNTLGDSNYFTK